MTTKIVLLGPAGVGKSALINHLNNGHFCYETDSTIGCQFVRIRKDDLIFDIWDTAGQERYMSITPIYFRNADIVIFVFDVTNMLTIDSMSKFVEMYFNTIKSNHAQIIFVGNKIDKENLSQKSLTDFFETNKTIKYYELDTIKLLFTSARDGTGMQMLLDKIIEHALTMKPKLKENTIVLDTKKTQSKCYWCV